MYKEYLHTLMSKYCSNVVLLLYCTLNSSFIFKTLHRPVFMSRRNATFWSKIGETGVGETGVGKQGISRWTPHSKSQGSEIHLMMTPASKV